MSAVLEPLTIRSGQGDYRVDFVSGIADLVEQLLAIDRGVVIIDAAVASLYADPLAELLAARAVHSVPASEDEKTLDGAERFLLFLQAHDATRQTQIIAIGGGVVQDIATFAAMLYYRGLALTLVPTTLLAMCDSCIGAKCTINLGVYKNQLGGFHSPSRVLVHLPFLDTLDDADVASGYGEIIKLCLTGPRDNFDVLSDAVASGGLRNDRLAELVHRSLRVKQLVIEEDEYERGRRRILNYGHTFGHTLEGLTGHAIPHGAAVAWGVDIANEIARDRGLLSEEAFDEIHGLIASRWSSTVPSMPTAVELIAGTRRDKKVVDGRLTLILLAAPGDLRIVPVEYDSQLHDEVARYLTTQSVVRSG